MGPCGVALLNMLKAITKKRYKSQVQINVDNNPTKNPIGPDTNEH